MFTKHFNLAQAAKKNRKTTADFSVFLFNYNGFALILMLVFLRIHSIKIY